MAIDIGQTTDGMKAALPRTYSSEIITETFEALKKIRLDKKILTDIGSNLCQKVMAGDYSRETRIAYARDISMEAGLNRVYEFDLTNLRSITALAIAKNKRDIQNYKKKYGKKNYDKNPPNIRKETAKLFKEASNIELGIANRMRAEYTHSNNILSHLRK